MTSDAERSRADALTAIRLSHHYEMARDRRKSIAEVAQLGLRSLILLNGGAVVALFTVLGHVDQLELRGGLLWCAFALFAGGVVAALLSTLLGFLASNANWLSEDAHGEMIYFHQLGDAQEGADQRSAGAAHGRVGTMRWILAVVAAGVSIAAFTVGSTLALMSVHVAAARKPADGQVACAATPLALRSPNAPHAPQAGTTRVPGR